MTKGKGSGWFGDHRRHVLAGKGVSTVLPDGRRLAVNNYVAGGKKPMNWVEVIFKNPKYNYKTSVSAITTEADARDYFVGHSVNVGVYPEEKMRKVIDIKYHKGE